MLTNLESIKFTYSEEDLALFNNYQKGYFTNISENYLKLKEYCLPEIEIIESGTQKEWIKARINLYVTTSIVRLLYITESFADASEKFNAAAVAVHIKAMVEIPMHLAYLFWIISEKHSFEEIREELNRLTWGKKNPDTGLTHISNITQKEMYQNADLITKKLFKETSIINIFETVYKEANAIGHHNYEGRHVLVGLQNKNTWKIKDRKEWFAFLSKNIFQFFLHADTILFMSNMITKAINHHINELPDNFPKPDK